LFISAIKASWVKRYLDNENSGQWKIFLKNRLEKYGNSLIFDCEIDEKLIKRISLNNNFLNNILTSWIKIKDNLNKDNIIVAKLIIWNNKNVTENKSTIFYKDWFDRGIQCFEHLFDYRNNTFYNFETFSYLYDIPKNDFLKYFKIISAIPPEIKLQLSIDGIILNSRTSLVENILKTKHVNKLLYNNLQIAVDKPTAEIKWESIFKDTNLSLEWKLIYKNIYTTTIDTILRNFQYKLVMRILPTNALLYKYKYVTSNICEQCNCFEETIEHMFWDCQITQNLLSNLNIFLANKNINIDYNKRDIMFGLSSNSPYSCMYNYLIILMKYFLFTMKIRKIPPTFQLFLKYLQHRIQIEKLIVINNNKIDTHSKKYEILENIFK